MGSYGPLDVVDEPIEADSSVGYLNCSGMGLFGKGEVSNWFENPLDCSEMVPQLFDYNRFDADNPVDEKNLYLESNCLLSNSNGTILNQLDGFGNQTGNVAAGHSGIDVKGGVVSVPGEILETKYGDNGIEGERIWCLGSNEESYLGTSGFPVQGVGKPRLSSSMISLRSEDTQHKHHVDIFKEETVMDLQGLGEEKQDLLDGALCGFMSQPPNLDDIVGGAVNIDSACGIEVSDSLQLSHLSGIVGSRFSRQLVLDDQETDEASNFVEIMENLEQNVDITMASSSLIASPSESTEDNHRKDNNKNVIGLSEATVMAPQRNVEAGTSDSLMTETACGEENSSNLGGPVTIKENYVDSSQQLALDIEGISGASGLVDSIAQTDVEGKDNLNNCSSDVLSSTRRSTRQRKSNKMPETKKTAARCRQISKNMVSQGGKSGISLKIARRQRSLTSRQERSSVWGSLGNVMTVFTEYDVILKQDTELVNVKNQRPRKRSGVQGNKRSQKTQTGGKYLPLKENGSDLDNQSDRSIPKFKLRGNEVKGSPDGVLPVVFDSLACLPTVISECAAEPDSQIGSEILKSDDRLKLDKSVNHRAEYTHIRDLDKPVTYLGAGVLDSQHGDKDLESTLTQDTSVGNICSVGPLVSSQKETGELEEIIDKNYSEAGTSPDSEVINLIQDVDISASAVLTSSQVVIGPIESAAQNTEHMSTRKGKKHGKVKGTKDMSTEEKLLGCGIQNKTKKYTKNRLGEKVRRGSNTTDSSIIEITGKTSNSSSSVKKRPTESHLVSETGRLEKAWEVGAIIPNREISEEGVWTGSSELGTAEGSMKAGKTVVSMQNSKSRNKLSKRRSHAPDPARSRRRNTCDEKKKSVQKSVNKKKVNEKAFVGHAVYEEENNQVAHGDTNWFPETKNHSEPREHAELSKMNVAGHEIPDVPEKSRVCEITAAMISSGLDGQILPPRKAWVLCDDCQKWRCISATLADSIEETNCRWTCKDNADKAFANCSIPQEKTNAEINAELEISDASGEEDAHGARINSNKPEGNQLTVAQQAPWKPIVSNLFLHRNRKNQPIDEVMVCHCKRPLDGRLGCGDECLNRMLNIECVRGTCPCGDRCANQQFQKRKYAKLEHFRCGKKGYGLQLLESVTQGKFLIEYVGEVLDLNAYEARQKEYALRGQRHFYFMTLNGSEVIDACAKGNLGRFINHSCDPNCRTEKWMVNGEVCIGLFALRNIKQGEELTFDYNYVRVFGAAAKKCVCGSSQCRGYIGGDPSNTETIVQSDSDEEFPEPVMVNEGSEDCLGKTNIFTRTIGSVQVHHGDKVVKSPSSWKRLEFPLEAEDNIPRSDYAVRPSSVSGLLDGTIGRSASAIQPLVMASQTDASDESLFPLLPFEVSLQEEDIMSKTSSSIKSVSSPIMDTMGGSISNSTAINSKPRSCTDEDIPNIMKTFPKTKSSRSSSSIKKGKCHSHPVAANKPQGLGNKPKKMLEAAVTNHLKGVEDKLNELLDADGGISKRKDSTKGYLKLLLVTAASDDNVKGEAVQSTRDLSIILDALLKTRSRIVLIDIVNKNGLQMLHNIMKQNRRNFNKIPIIRKLLKVLTFLAEKEILSLEHINSAPTCAGVESFKESIIQLTRHNDIKVHQIARSFRDKWIPRTSRRNLYLDRDDIKLELQGGVNYNRFSTSYNGWHDQGERPIDAMDCTTQDETSGSFTDQFSSQGHKSRKRKSRWDKPSEINRDQHLTAFMVDRKIKQRFECRAQPPELRQVTDQVAQANGEEMMCIDRAHSVSQPTEFSSSIGAQDIIDEAPPGFSSPLNSPWPSGDDILSTTSNHSLHTHYGKSAWEISMGCHQERYLPHLPVSYGIPLVFAEQLGTPQSETIDSWSVAPGIPFHPFPPLPTYPRDRSNILRVFAVASNEHGEQLQENNDVPCQGIRPPDVASTGASNQKMGAQMRCSSGSLGRRYFRQQKWNNWGKRPPWLRKGGNARQNSSRSQGRNVGLGILENEAGGSGGGENLSSTSYQRPHRHHDH